MTCLRYARCSLVLTALALGCTTPEPTGGDADGSSSATAATATDDSTLGATSMPVTGDGTTDAADGTTTTGTGSSGDTTETTETTETTDTGPTPQCTGVRAFQCTEPLDCPPDACGGPLSPFDADGCMRPPCSVPEDCDPGFACVRAEDYGGCESSGMLCQDDPRTGQCQCVSTPDCGGGHCLPEDEVPPLD
jgi:hypothetical protein